MNDLPDSPPVGGTVRVCGERGLVAFCVKCQDWEPVYLREKRWSGNGGGGLVQFNGAECLTCDTEFPRGPSYKTAEKQ